MEKNYEYEEDLDILYVYNNPLKEGPIGNVVLDNMVIDIGENGKVLGIEIDCPSPFFNLSREQLKNLKNAQIKIIKIGKTVSVGIFLSTESREHSFQLNIPREYSEKASH